MSVSTDATDGPFEQALQRLAQSPGDQEAWRKLVDQSWDYVCHAAAFHLGAGYSSTSAEDVAQDVFFQLARAAHAGSLRWPADRAGCLALLHILTRNRTLDILRRVHRQRRDVHRDSHRAGIDEVPAPGPAVNMAVEAGDFLTELNSRLDLFDQTILDLLMHEKGPTEIADALGTSVKTIQRHRRIIRQIAKRLHSGNADPSKKPANPRKPEKNVPGGA